MEYTTATNKKQAFTLHDIAMMDKTVLIPEEAASVLGVKPQAIRLMAETSTGREALGFPVIRLGRQTRIPRIPFLHYMGWEGEITGAKEEIS